MLPHLRPGAPPVYSPLPPPRAQQHGPIPPTVQHTYDESDEEEEEPASGSSDEGSPDAGRSAASQDQQGLDESAEANDDMSSDSSEAREDADALGEEDDTYDMGVHLFGTWSNQQLQEQERERLEASGTDTEYGLDWAHAMLFIVVERKPEQGPYVYQNPANGSPPEADSLDHLVSQYGDIMTRDGLKKHAGPCMVPSYWLQDQEMPIEKAERPLGFFMAVLTIKFVSTPPSALSPPPAAHPLPPRAATPSSGPAGPTTRSRAKQEQLGANAIPRVPSPLPRKTPRVSKARASTSKQLAKAAPSASRILMRGKTGVIGKRPTAPPKSKLAAAAKAPKQKAKLQSAVIGKRPTPLPGNKSAAVVKAPKHTAPQVQIHGVQCKEKELQRYSNLVAHFGLWAAADIGDEGRSAYMATCPKAKGEPTDRVIWVKHKASFKLDVPALNALK